MTNGFVNEILNFTPRMQIVGPAQIEALHTAILEVLDRIGVEMVHDKGLEIMHGIGCRVDGKRVRIPPYLVERALATAPKRLVLGNRKGKRAVELGGGGINTKTWFGPSIDCMDYLDPDTNKRGRFTTKLCEVSAGLVDVLDNFDWQMTIGMADDFGQEAVDKVIARKALSFCEKPLVYCCNDVASVKAIHEMSMLVQGGREAYRNAPISIHYSEPISPLKYYAPAVEKLIYCAENWIPLINFPCPSGGGTSPMTMAGNIVQGMAESLSGLVLQQAISPGASFVCGAYTSVLNMRTTIFSYGAPELSIMVGAQAQLAQYYKLPFFATGGCTDAKFADAQAAAEATYQCLINAAVGAGLVHDCTAWIDHGTTISPAFMVLVNEILENIKQLMGGLEVSPETLAVEIMEKVGPGGNYLREKHTLKNFKKVRYSDLWDRSILGNWEAAGSKNFDARLREKTLELMKHQPAPLPPEVIKEMDKMQATWVKK